RLLVVKRLLLAVRIPVAIPDWPKNVVGGCYKIEESKRRLGHGEKRFVGPTLSCIEKRVRQNGVRISHARFEPQPVRSLRTVVALNQSVSRESGDTLNRVDLVHVRTP